MVKVARRCGFAGPDENDPMMDRDKVKPLLKKEIDRAIADGITTFVVGLSRGVDLWAGDIIADMKDENKSLKLIVVMPYKGYGDDYNLRWKQMFNYVCAFADYKKVLHSSFTGYEVYEEQVKYILNNCERMVVFYNGDEKTDSYDAMKFAPESKMLKKVYFYATNDNVYENAKEELSESGKWRVSEGHEKTERDEEEQV